MAFLIGALLIFTALFLLFSALSGMGDRRGVSRSLEVLEAMTSAPTELTEELDRPFGERVLDPLSERLQGITRRLTGADQVDRIRMRLDKAGNPPGWTVDRVATGKVVGAVAGAVAGVWMAWISGSGWGVAIAAVAGGLLLGFHGPTIWLYNFALKRDETMKKEMADAIDLLTISVEAGLGFDAALQQVARNTAGPLSQEFGRVLHEMQLGRGRSDALRALGDRTSIPEIRGFVSAMVQADSFGIPIGQVLRVQSSEIRVKRRQHAEEKAGQVPVKIMIPVVLFILPCLFIVVMGPAVMDIAEAFS